MDIINKIYKYKEVLSFLIVLITFYLIVFNNQKKEKESKIISEKEHDRNIYKKDYIEFLSECNIGFDSDIYRKSIHIVESIRIFIDKYGLERTCAYIGNNSDNFTLKEDKDCYPFIFQFDLKKNSVNYHYHPNKILVKTKSITSLRNGLLKTYGNDLNILNLLKRFKNVGDNYKYGFISYKWPSGMKNSKQDDLIYKTTYIQKYKDYYICCDISYKDIDNPYDFSKSLLLMGSLVLFCILWILVHVEKLFDNLLVPFSFYLITILGFSKLMYSAYEIDDNPELLKSMYSRLSAVLSGLLGLTIGVIILCNQASLKKETGGKIVPIFVCALLCFCLASVGFLDKSGGYTALEYNYKFSLLLSGLPFFILSIIGIMYASKRSKV